jgi:molybdopterin synthase sulfur carrier subunit
VVTVFIPSMLQEAAGGRTSIEAAGETVRQVIDNLERVCPGIRDRLLDGGRLRPNISVAVDGEITPLGLVERVRDGAEIHFVTAIKGGRRGDNVSY